MITVLLDYILFLTYSAIYYYASFLMQLTEMIKTLILLFILLHIYGVAIARLEDCITLTATSFSPLNRAEAYNIDKIPYPRFND